MMTIGAKRALGTLLSLAVLLTATVLTAAPAAADCRVVRVYEMTNEGRWATFESLFVPPSTGPVTQTIRASRTHSGTTEVSAELEMSAQAVVAEVNAKLGTSYSTTVTVESGRETSVTAPASSSPQEIRFGVYLQHFLVREEIWGCPNAPVSNDRSYVNLPKESAGVVVAS